MTAKLREFAPEDDLLHPESATGPLARESLAFTAPIPQEELLVFLYAWREGGTRWGRFVCIAGPDPTRPLHLSFEGEAAYSGDDLRDFTVSGLHCRQSEPLKVAQLSFAEPGLDLEVRFAGMHAPFSWHDNASGCADWMAHDRYEQSCTTSGRLRLPGRDVEFTGFGHRDHSWGNRDWRYMLHWKWINAATPDGSLSVHCTKMYALGNTLLYGYVNRAGALSRIVHADVQVDLDEKMMHRQVTARFQGESGGEVTMEAKYAAGWAMPVQHLVLHEVGMSGALDGRPATAHIEMGWPAAYVSGITETPERLS
ncbi:MAG TPA: hypothetical protein VHU88_11880 [Sporichthyaceae bacterium]|jgi:hypothetical protein|nr:hypothetical protein [Sporichthyaceae bacterium]